MFVEFLGCNIEVVVVYILPRGVLMLRVIRLVAVCTTCSVVIIHVAGKRRTKSTIVISHISSAITESDKGLITANTYVAKIIN